MQGTSWKRSCCYTDAVKDGLSYTHMVLRRNYEPKEVVENIIDEQYDVIAITDHEVTDGIAEAKAAAEGTLIKVIPGIELATDMDGKELHILGYNIDENN